MDTDSFSEATVMAGYAAVSVDRGVLRNRREVSSITDEMRLIGHNIKTGYRLYSNGVDSAEYQRSFIPF
jgi:hypothetical protein